MNRTIYIDGQFKSPTKYVTKKELEEAIGKNLAIKRAELIDNKLVLVFETSEGEKEVSVDLNKFVDVYLPGEGIKIVDKVISLADATALDLENKVDKIEGKGLSTNDYTDAEKKKLNDIKPITTGMFTPNPNTVILTLERYGAGLGPLAMTLNPATSEKAGIMTYADRIKLNSIEESANNYIHPTTPGNKHIPSGGASGQILVFSEDGTALWADSSSKIEELFTALNKALENLLISQQKLDKLIADLNNNIDLYSYGVEWDTTVASPILTRIGNPLLHKSLPILSEFKGVLANGSEIVKYLNPNDWRYSNTESREIILTGTDTFTAVDSSEYCIGQYIKTSENLEGIVTAIEDGIITVNWQTDTPEANSTQVVVIGEKLDGSNGTVRIHIPKFYGKSGENGNKRWVRISTVKIDDTWTEIPEMLVDAYRSTIDLSTNKAVSVVNTSTIFRGGTNDNTLDPYLTTDPFRSNLGKPRTNIPRATMRTYATNAGSELLCYEYYKWIFYWCYVIEYANFNSLAAYNAELTSDGYRQGGLGNGVTTIAYWSNYNLYNPITPCGYGNEFGNFTGIKEIPATTYNVTTTATTNINIYLKDTAAAVIAGSTNLLTITEVKKANTKYAYCTFDFQSGTTTYTITGLQDSQTIEFVTSSTVIATASSDGDIVVEWSGTGERQIRSQFTGECNITISIKESSSETISLTRTKMEMPRWRGFDNPFGDIYTNLEGIVLLRSAANLPSIVYSTTDVSCFTDNTEDKLLIGVEIAADGYITKFDLGNTAEIIPSAVGGTSTTYKCDYHWCYSSYTARRALLVGGHAYGGANAGLAYFNSSYSVGGAGANVGFRTLTRI